MKQVPIQQDNVTSLSADYFNDIPRELENLIQSAGIALATPPAGSDLNQAGKAVAVYAGGGDFYIGGGTANAQTLTPLGSHRQVPEYFAGLRVRFRPSASNTSTTVTLKLGDLDEVGVNIGQLDNGESPSVAIGDIAIGEVYEAVYDTTPDTLTNYWRIMSVVTKHVSGSGLVSERSFSQTKLSDPFEGSYISARVSDGLVYYNGTNGRRSAVDGSGTDIIDAPGTLYSLRNLNSGRGVSYIDGPGVQPVLQKRPSIFDVSSLVWAPSGVSFIWTSPTDIDLTGIPWPSNDADQRFFTVNLRYRLSASSNHFVCPVFCQLNNNGGTTRLTNITVISVLSPGDGTVTDQELFVSYDASDVD
jgi:hypothetical protein